MLKDLESSSRHQDHLRKIKKKWMDESKKYKESIEKLLLTSLENNQKTRMKERQKAIESMMEKEKLARENVEKFLIQQEKDRLQLQKDSDQKSKKILLFI